MSFESSTTRIFLGCKALSRAAAQIQTPGAEVSPPPGLPAHVPLPCAQSMKSVANGTRRFKDNPIQRGHDPPFTGYVDRGISDSQHAFRYLRRAFQISSPPPAVSGEPSAKPLDHRPGPGRGPLTPARLARNSAEGPPVSAEAGPAPAASGIPRRMILQMRPMMRQLMPSIGNLPHHRPDRGTKFEESRFWVLTGPERQCSIRLVPSHDGCEQRLLWADGAGNP